MIKTFSTIFKNDYLDKQINTEYIQNDEIEKTNSEVANIPQITKILVNHHSARKKHTYVSS